MRSLTAVVAAALVLLPAAPAWAANGAPVVVDDAVTYRNEGGQLNLVNALANDSDPDGDTLTYTAVTPATKGEPSIWDGKLYYRPNGDATGTDTFTYTVSDGHGNAATGRVTATLWIDAAAPPNATISIPSPGSARLTWSAGDRAVEYRIRRNGVVVGSTTGLTWTDTGLSDDTHYEYFIASVDAAGVEGRWSYNLDRWATLPTPRDITVDLTDDPTSLLVDWAPWNTLGPWRIYRDGVPVATTPTSDFRDSGLTTGRAYSYQVQLLDGAPTTEVWPPSALSAAVEGTPHALSPIAQRFWDLGSTQGRLGPITVAERAVSGGSQQDHRNGVIVQRAGQAAVVVYLPFATAYAAAGGPAGELGFPLADEKCSTRRVGCGQSFEGGSIWRWAFSASTFVPRVIEGGWGSTGWEDGPLGFPTGDRVSLAGGVKQAFEGGAVYYSAATGSHGVRGPINDRWAATGYEDGDLGYPSTDLTCGQRGGGCMQGFEHGYIHWTPTTGAQITSGAILTAFARAGWQNGTLGYPLTSTTCGLRDGGCGQRFQGGYLHWTPTTGAQTTSGAILTAWSRAGWQNGKLGYPTTSTTCGQRGGGCMQGFQGGYIHWTPTTGAQITSGAILTAWSRAGWQNGRLGYPLTSTTCGLRGGGCGQRFQGGYLHWSPTTGAHMTSGVILATWSRSGWQNGRLGYPTSEATISRGVTRQSFQGGVITVDTAGRARIAYR